MDNIYLVATDSWLESIITDKFATTVWGTIGIIKKRYEWVYGEGIEYRYFEFPEDTSHDFEVKFQCRLAWEEDFEQHTYYVYVSSNITKQLTIFDDGA